MTVASPPLLPSATRLTAKQFEKKGDTKGLELDEGVIVEKAMGARSDWVAVRLSSRIEQFCQTNRLGWVFGSEAGYTCFSNPNTVRKPNGSFIKFGRLPNEQLPDGWIDIVPDLVFESVSPRDRAIKLERKLHQYRSAKIPLIWVIYPETRSALVLHASGARIELGENDYLEGHDALPGFRLRLGEIFPPANPAAEPPAPAPQA